MTDALSKEFTRQSELFAWLNGRFRIPLNNLDDKARLYLSAYDLCIEHHASLIMLFQAGHYGSMFALLRVQFESLVRAQYLHYCASEGDWQKFKADKDIDKFINLIYAVETKIGDEHNVLSKLKNNSYSIFSSFTHTGYEHLVRRISAENVGAVNYPENELLQSLKCSGSLALLAYGGLVEMAQNRSLTEDFFTKLKEYAL